MKISMAKPERQHPLVDLEDYYWPCGGGLSAVNVTGTQLRDLINSRLTDSGWHIKGTPPWKTGGIP